MQKDSECAMLGDRDDLGHDGGIESSDPVCTCRRSPCQQALPGRSVWQHLHLDGAHHRLVMQDSLRDNAPSAMDTTGVALMLTRHCL